MQTGTEEISEDYFFPFYSLVFPFLPIRVLFPPFLKSCFLLVTFEIPGLVFCLNSMFHLLLYPLPLEGIIVKLGVLYWSLSVKFQQPKSKVINNSPISDCT